MPRSLITILIIFNCHLLIGQDNDIPPELKEITNSIEEELFVEDNDLLEQIESFKTNPININLASEIELNQSGLFTKFQAYSIIQYRRKYGYLLTGYELSNVLGFDVNDAQRIFAFVTTEKKHTEKQRPPKPSKLLLRSTVNTDKELHNLLKANINTSHFRIFYTNENDYGEALNDFQSGSIEYNSNSGNTTIVVGDYRISLGYGLLFDTRFKLTKPTTLQPLFNNNKTIRGYSSSNENNFLRGFTANYHFNNSNITIYTSSKKIDCNLKESSENITSIVTSGIHSTENELEKKGNTKEKIAGIAIQRQLKSINIGINGCIAQYNRNFSIDNIEKAILDTSHTKEYINPYYSYFNKHLSIKGEASYLLNNKVAYFQNITYYAPSAFSFSLTGYHYPANYFAPYSNIIRNSSKTSNEQGLYSLIEVPRFYDIKISIGSHIYQNLWLKSSKYNFTPNQSLFTRIEYHPLYNVITRVGFKSTIKTGNMSQASMTNTTYNQLTEQTKTNSCYGYLSLPLSEKIKFAHKIQYKVAGEYKGHMFTSTIKFRYSTNGAASIQYNNFNSDHATVTPYNYEPDVLYAFSYPGYYGVGERITINCSYKLWSKINFYSKCFYETKKNENTNVKKWQLRFQLIYTL
ncbi:helix-hairpin-helix domain-containing protein [Bacteroidales bacterium]|nr:helix-hairpin-helix domain-containing protein [Bacteroidales bacterium]